MHRRPQSGAHRLPAPAWIRLAMRWRAALRALRQQGNSQMPSVLEGATAMIRPRWLGLQGAVPACQARASREQLQGDPNWWPY